jgi:Fe-S cluster assembly protein SufD
MPSTLTDTAPLPLSFDETAFEAFLETRIEPHAVTENRRQAFATFRELQAEELDPEEWKRIDLRAFRPEAYAITPTETDEAGFESLMADNGDFGGSVAFVDGRCTRSTLDDDLTAQGVLFGDLAELLRSHSDVLAPHFLTRAVKPDTDRFTAWHAAFWTGGTVLYVPRGVEIKKPLHSLIGLASDGAADCSHTLVILEDGASATLLEETASANDSAAGLHVGAVELLVGPGANLCYVQLQNWNHQVRHFAHQVGRIERDGFLQWTVGGLGAKLAHIHQDVHLDGRGSNAEVNGVTFALGRQLLSYYTKQSHNAEDTHSDLLYKDVLRDRARVVWRGMIRVEPEAQRTDGYQRCDSLVLNSDCRADSIPGLEIEADDVKCSHGATVGRVDEEQLFYCMCRGLSKTEAMHLLVEGFFQEVVDRIPVEVVRETLSRTVERKLGIGD